MLPNVDTWRLEEPGALEEVLDRLDELVVKPVDGSGGKGLVVGPAATQARARRRCAQRLIADPRGWIAQPVVQLSTVPTLVDDGIAPRHVDLRPFAVNDGNDVWVLPGGLTRVALPEGELVVNIQPGRRVEGHLGASDSDPSQTARHNIQGARRRLRPPSRSRSRSSPAITRRTTRRSTRRATSRSSNSSSKRSLRLSKSPRQLRPSGGAAC